MWERGTSEGENIKLLPSVVPVDELPKEMSQNVKGNDITLSTCSYCVGNVVRLQTEDRRGLKYE
jgi:hypothetical protein